jgi:F0F1-type ATP synthase delta subunit
MNTSKKYLNLFSKSLYKKSLNQGLIDEKKVRIILSQLDKFKPAKLSSILKTYKRLIGQKMAREEIIIETNDKMTFQKSFVDNLKKKTGAVRIINKTNPKIVFGVKVYNGDWIWDETLEGKLNQITK